MTLNHRYYLACAAACSLLIVSGCGPSKYDFQQQPFAQSMHIDADLAQPDPTPTPTGIIPDPVPTTSVPGPTNPGPTNPTPKPTAQAPYEPHSGGPAGVPTHSPCPNSHGPAQPPVNPAPGIPPSGSNASHACGEKNDKVLICHVPPGNASNAHTICVSPQGAEHGHGVNLDGSLRPGSLDRLGECGSQVNANPAHGAEAESD